MTDAQTEARAIAQTSLWVPAKPEHAKIGWTYDFEQTERIARAAYDSTGYDAVMEVVEFVMAEADRRHATALAAKDAELAAVKKKYQREMDLECERANRAEELAEKYKWQVRDTCARAERAEAQLAEITEGSRQEFAANMGPMRAYWLQTDHTRLMAENGNLRALLAEKNKALEPFALLANSFDGIPPPKYFGDTDGELRYPNEHKTLVEISKLRAARRAREAQGGDDVL